MKPKFSKHSVKSIKQACKNAGLEGMKKEVYGNMYEFTEYRQEFNLRNDLSELPEKNGKYYNPFKNQWYD